MSDKKISKLIIDYGPNMGTHIIESTKESPIEKITKNGEMALVEWFSQMTIEGKSHEYNGKYVIEIIYEWE